MNTCKQCKQQFSTYAMVDGKKKNLTRRKYCLICLPYSSGRLKKTFQDENNKLCTKCNEIKPKSDFYVRKDRGTLFCYCKKCSVRARNQNLNKLGMERKIKLVREKGGKCERCGYNKNYAALHFHHLNPSNKLFSLISRSLAKNKWKTIIEEADKCILLCAVCHAEEHHPGCLL